MAITTLNNRSINRSDTAASGQFWTATSATASDFQAGGGAWTFLNKQTASADSILEWNSQITSTYDVYKLFCSNAHSATDEVQLLMQFRQSSSYLTANYRWSAGQVRDNSGTVDASYDISDSFIRLTRDATGNATGETWNFEITFWDLLGTDNYKKIHWNGVNINHDGTSKHEIGDGVYFGGVGALDGFKIYMSSGNIATGEFSLFGLAQS